MEDVRSSESAIRKTPIPFWFWEVFFVFLILVGLIELFDAEKVAGHSWFLQFQLVVLWLLIALSGAGVSRLCRSGKFDTDNGGWLLMMLALIASSAFELLGKVVSFR